MKQIFNPNYLPVFPLNSVIFVNGILQLQIFEQRYLDLVKSCMKNQHGFIVVLIREGKEVDDIPEVYSIGTYVEIIDWGMLSNNLLSISIKGLQRVQIDTIKELDSKLLSAEITYLDNLKSQASDNVDEDLITLLQTLHDHDFVLSKYPDIDYTSGIEIAYKLCELLPSTNHEKQMLLEASQIEALQNQLRTLISRLENLSPENGFL